ncbi:MAG: phosphopantetheine-binding protein [Crocinitomicaceae bacterium]
MEDFLKSKIEEIAFSEVERSEKLWNTGILDSITIVELAVEIEEEYGIKIAFDEIIEDNFMTIDQLIVFIEKKQNERVG